MTEKEIWQSFCRKNNIDVNTPYDAWKFCGGGPEADELASLVLNGTKTATASLKIAFEAENIPLPEAGAYSVILFDNDTAACVIQTVKISIVPFGAVSAGHAYKEGEGDRSLEFWRTAHINFFKPICKAEGWQFDDTSDCVLEEFEVVYK